MSICSGNVGFCHEKGHPIGIVITWDNDNNVIGVDCNHATCGYSDNCELYQKYPIGYHQDCPNEDGAANL